MKSKPDVCIYHANCADGFGAAWAIWRRWPDGVRFVQGIYGQDPPDVTGLDVLLVDFSYKRPVLEAMASTARSITILDHHKSAEADLAAYNNPYFMQIGLEPFIDMCQFSNQLPIRAWFDMEKSGAVMAWMYANPAHDVPRLLLHIQDRDLWRFALPNTREIQACVFSHPYDLSTWNELADRCATEEGRAMMIAEGAAIERKHFKDVRELLGVATRSINIGGFRVPVANLPYTLASDAAGILAEGNPFAATYYDSPTGRVFSLRSRGERGLDVSEIARIYGGGGHRNAAGFTMPIGWEGDP